MIIIVANYMKPSYHYQPFSRSLFYFIFAISIIVWLMNVVLIVLEGIFGLVGFNNSTQISSTCNPFSQTYYYVKYNTNITTLVQLCFAFTIIAVIFATVLTIILLVLLIKLVKEEVVAFRKPVKVAIYVCCSLLVLADIVPAGYYLSFSKELAQCAVKSYNSSQVQAVAIIAIIIVALGLLMWLLFIFYFYQRVSSQEKYREVGSNQTEPQQKVQQVQQHQENKPKKQYEAAYNTTHQKEQARKEIYKHEETQQNLYESPSKRKMNTFSKEPERNHQPSHNNTYYNNQQRKYAPQRSFKKETEDNTGQLVLMKERKNPATFKDEQDYKEYEQQYRKNQGGRPILPSNGVQERDYKGSDYYRSGGSPPQRFSPSRNNQKQGILVRYIRGKYAV